MFNGIFSSITTGELGKPKVEEVLKLTQWPQTRQYRIDESLNSLLDRRLQVSKKVPRPRDENRITREGKTEKEFLYETHRPDLGKAFVYVSA